MKMKKSLMVMMILLAFALTGCASAMYYTQASPIYNQYYSDSETQEEYSSYLENSFIQTTDMPVSTFSVDVDTASYSNVRRLIMDGELPEKSAVRIEEFINYFDYNLETPATGEDPIKITTELASAPWNEDHQLLMVGLTTSDIVYEDSAANNLVFLLDVSGSMCSSDKLPLLQSAMKLLVNELRPNDRISIVVYAGASGVVLEGADSTDKEEIIEAIDSLSAGGSTAGGAGIKLAYQIAQKYFIEGGNNRVILGTDGDFNVGVSTTSGLEDLIAEKRETGIFLSVLGFGTGNLKDNKMETLADKGNGVYYYIDSILEAKKVFVNELGATMVTVAKDVKLQLEFNSMNVKAYRLIGYENRLLSADDFANDAVDAGDMGSGHEVIAFYEIIPYGSEETVDSRNYTIPDELRYDGDNYSNELMSLSIRYKDPDSSESKLIQSVVMTSDETSTPSETFCFASAVVEYGMLLIDSEYRGNANFDQVLSIAQDAQGEDEFGYREEFIQLVGLVKQLSLLNHQD